MAPPGLVGPIAWSIKSTKSCDPDGGEPPNRSELQGLADQIRQGLRYAAT